MWNAWPFCDSPFKLQLKWIKYIYLPHPVNLPLEYYLADAINPSSAVFFCRLWNENAHPRNLLRSSFESQAAIKLAAVQRGSFHHPARLMKVTPMLHLKNRADTQNEVMTSLGLRWIATPPPLVLDRGREEVGMIYVFTRHLERHATIGRAASCISPRASRRRCESMHWEKKNVISFYGHWFIICGF